MLRCVAEIVIELICDLDTLLIDVDTVVARRTVGTAEEKIKEEAVATSLLYEVVDEGKL